MVSGSVTAAAVTLATSGTNGRPNVVPASAAAMASAAGCISEQWNGADTGSSTEWREPFALASAIARATAFSWPETTTCPGALSLATSQTWSCAASAATAATVSRSRPISTAIAPTPTGTAACIACPRARSSRAVSASVSTPAAQSALYSPRLCPATKAAEPARLSPPSCSSTRSTAIDTAMIAGWAFSVSVSSVSEPSNISRDRCCDSAESTSSNTARAAGLAALSALPMPADWLPWPGKTNARVKRRSFTCCGPCA